MRGIVIAAALTMGVAMLGANGAGAVPVQGAGLARAAADASPVVQARWCRTWHGWRSGWHRRCWW
jgi:hypothetical protein